MVLVNSECLPLFAVDKSAVQIAKKAAVEETPGEKKNSSSSSSSASETKDQHTGAKGVCFNYMLCYLINVKPIYSLR